MFGLLITLLWRWGTGGLGRENVVPLLPLFSSLQWLRSDSRFLSGQLMWLHLSNPPKPHPALICIVIGCALLGRDLGEVLCHFPLHRQSCRDAWRSLHLTSSHFCSLLLFVLSTTPTPPSPPSHPRMHLSFQTIRRTNRPWSVRQIPQIFNWNWRPVALSLLSYLFLNG